MVEFSEKAWKCFWKQTHTRFESKNPRDEDDDFERYRLYQELCGREKTISDIGVYKSKNIQNIESLDDNNKFHPAGSITDTCPKLDLCNLVLPQNNTFCKLMYIPD